MLSVWEKESYFAPVDVLIAGGGLLGWWTASEVKQHFPSARVLIVEKGALPEGASTKNAGFACFGSPGELLADAKTMGEDAMLQLVEMRYKGIDKLRQRLGDAAIDYDECGGYECFEHHAPELEEQLYYLNKVLAPITGTASNFGVHAGGAASMGMKGFGALVENPHEGGIHSGRTLLSLRRLAQSVGVLYRSGEALEEMVPGNGAVAVQLTHGQLYARRVVVATNAYLSRQFPSLGIVPARGQMLLTRPVHGLMLSGTFHFDEGFYYWRNLGNRVLVGGARNVDFEAERTLDSGTSHAIQQVLEEFLCRHLPGYFHPESVHEQVEMRWGGLMAMTQQKQPVLQEMLPGVWAAMCCNGMGVAISPVFAELVTAAVTVDL